jgi:glycosyltransferase involved in cell wall biosynthesis
MRNLTSLFLSYLKYWDKKGSKNVDHFISISKEVEKRIKHNYNRKSTVIYPPVETEFFQLNKLKDDYYLMVSRLIEYKRIDLVINTFKKLNKEIIIAGTGRDERRLRNMAKGYKNIQFQGRVKDSELRTLYQNAKAFINPQIEDFGITVVEAQASGTPVIAYGKGGALETVIEGKTGHFFHEQTPEALIKAINEFEQMKFNPKDCRENALKYDKEIFKKKIKTFVEEKYQEWKRNKYD